MTLDVCTCWVWVAGPSGTIARFRTTPPGVHPCDSDELWVFSQSHFLEMARGDPHWSLLGPQGSCGLM